jgi:photosystem II stability/assembly factor-like uncharacterized protein
MWTSLPLPKRTDKRIALVPVETNDSKVIFLESFRPKGSGLESVAYLTTDGGQTWTNLGAPKPVGSAVMIDPANPTQLLNDSVFPRAVTPIIVDILPDRTTVWSLCHTWQRRSGMEPVGRTLVYRSDDRGRTWTLLMVVPRESVDFYQNIFWAVNRDILIIGTLQDGVCLTVNGGTTWKAIRNGWPTAD